MMTLIIFLLGSMFGALLGIFLMAIFQLYSQRE